jgi:hypothetical protein
MSDAENGFTTESPRLTEGYTEKATNARPGKTFTATFQSILRVTAVSLRGSVMSLALAFCFRKKAFAKLWSRV